MKTAEKIMELIEKYALDMSTYITCKDDMIAIKLKEDLEDQKAWLFLEIQNIGLGEYSI